MSKGTFIPLRTVISKIMENENFNMGSLSNCVLGTVGYEYAGQIGLGNNRFDEFEWCFGCKWDEVSPSKVDAISRLVYFFKYDKCPDYMDDILYHGAGYPKEYLDIRKRIAERFA